MDCRSENRKIRVSAISTGPIDTPGIDGLDRNDEQAGQLKKSLITAVPMGRLGSPDEVPKTVLFLALNDSSFVTSVELFVDGGMAQT